MNAESDTIVVAQPTNRVSPARLGREQDAGMALFPPGQLPSTQIPADWRQNDPTKPDYIKNKPEIPSEPSDIGAATSAQGAKADSAYQKPATGIPASDLAAGVIPAVPVKAVKCNGTALTPDEQGAVNVDVPTTAADVGAANQTAIAAAFAAKEYAVGELATYNGLLYRCKSEYTATASSAKPDADTTHWEAAVVAVLLDGKLSTSGGTVNGDLFVSGVIQGSSDVLAPNGRLVVGTVGEDATNFYTSGIRTQGHGAPIQYPAYIGDGTDFFALIQHIAANFSTSASYVVGQLVVYQGTLYRCTNAHSAGAWDANDFTAATVEEALSAIRSSIPDINGKLDATKRNMLDYESGGSTEIALSAQTAVYRGVLGTDGSFPYIEDSGIPTASAYYQFELELSVPSTVPSTITGPTGWTWLDGHGLPDPADLSGGETICISVRLDCTARTFLASVWRVA